MGITQQIGASSLIKPGVIDSAAARPASPYEGQVIFQKDTDQLLVWNGTAWVIPNSPAQNPGGLEFIKSQVPGSGVSSVTVTDAFSSTYDNYRIVVTGITPDASNTWRLMIGSGRTNAHYGVMNYSPYSGAVGDIRVGNEASIHCNLTQINVNNAQFTCDILSPFLATRTTMIGQGFGRLYYCDFAGADDSLVSYTSFTLLTNGGTMSGGNIAVYGYRK